MKGKIQHSVLILAVLLMCVSGCNDKKQDESERAFEIENDYIRSPLTVWQKISKKKIGLSDLLILQLQAIAEEGYVFEMPSVVDMDLGKFEVVDWKDLGDRLTEEGELVRTFQYRLEPSEPGKWWLPEFSFTFMPEGDKQAQAKELLTEPIEIEVVSLIDEQGGVLEVSDIETIAQPEKVYWPYAVTAGCITLLAGGYFLISRFKKADAGIIRIMKTPHEIACERLEELIAEKLIENQQFKPFYEKSSNILRHYIEDRFALKAPERTTEEFLYELKSQNVLEDADKKTLAEFLGHCDLVKFAKYQADSGQMTQSLQVIENFIRDTKSDRCRIDIVTGQRFVQEGRV